MQQLAQPISLDGRDAAAPRSTRAARSPTRRVTSSAATSTTCTPAERAIADTSRTRWVLPMPASPSRTTAPPAPATSDETKLCSAASSSTRPTVPRAGPTGRRVGRLPELPAIGEALEALAAPIDEGNCRGDPDQLSHDVGDEDLSAVGACSDASRGVDCAADRVGRRVDHLAGVDPDPHPRRRAGERPLGRQGEPHRLAGRTERQHQPVTEGLHLPAAVGVDPLADPVELTTDRLGPGEIADTIDERGRTLHVGEHHRGQPDIARLRYSPRQRTTGHATANPSSHGCALDIALPYCAGHGYKSLIRARSRNIGRRDDDRASGRPAAGPSRTRQPAQLPSPVQ